MAKKKNDMPAQPIQEDIIQADFCDEMSQSFVDYSVSVITDRALPDVRDGLKPVHRRILYAMHTMGIHNSGPHKKVARIVGDTMGKFHPHGDASIEGALVHMAQPWCYLHPLVDGHGNYGSIEGDPAAASRYIEARLGKYADDVMLSNLTVNTIDFVSNYDDTTQEPTVLPATIPHILIGGSDGIAVGMASKMPTHNLGDVVDATIAMLDNPKITDEQLVDYLHGPDFATGGIVVNKSELVEVYKNGQGRIRIRGKVHVEDGERGKKNIVITEIPYTMIGAIEGFMDTIAELSRNKTMPDVTDIKNLSDKDGICIIVELRKDADVEYNINILYKKAKLEDTFGYNATLLSNKVPAVMSLSRIIHEFLEFYRETLTRKYKSLLETEKKRAEIKEGLIKAVDVIDTIIEILRGSTKVEMAKKCLMKGDITGIKFKTKTAEREAKKLCFTEIQADAVLAMQLQKLIGLELEALTKEYNTHLKNINEYSSLLNSKTKMSNKMRADMLDVKKRYAQSRKTEIIDATPIVIKAPEVKPEKMYVLVNRFGYIKLISEDTYARNITNIAKDYKFVTEVMNTGTVYLFTAEGKCHMAKATAIPAGKMNEKGVPMETISALSSGENVIAVLSDINPKTKFLFGTANGMVKLTPVSEFVASRRTIDATKLAGDTLLIVAPVKEETVVMVTKSGQAVSFAADGVSTMKRNAVGIIGIKMDAKDEVVAIYSTTTDAIEYNGKVYPIKSITGKRGSKGKPLA
ncbi:MAG: hypothetical protein IJZ68_07925 [Bacteroidaceae bacterium]|nr:hypothetical protein [Bacteroidaceae bacterium]